MASNATNSKLPSANIESFSVCLKSADRILALLGAGLSASSGLPTFRGAGGLWRRHDAMQLATPEAFDEDPGLVWQFYSYRRHMALQAKPNKAHFALAKLARQKKNFVTLSQNVDGLSQRAKHPMSQLHLLHGSLYDVKCTGFYCNYVEQNNFTDPIVPALAIPSTQFLSSSNGHPDGEATSAVYNTTEERNAKTSSTKELDISDEKVAIPSIQKSDLPHCPKCKTGLLRPGVVWFGEMLPKETLSAIDQFIAQPEKIDLILVIGTSAKVYPAAAYIDKARAKGARVAVVNMDRADAPGGKYGLRKGDWFFEGDAAVLIPQMLEEVVGKIK
ncbi:MAG: hypothetical protein M1835_005589 [Candelina submexicana]|nr:MAG: hypothetical protein M1835_005589 [Candelina submexicana]